MDLNLKTKFGEKIAIAKQKRNNWINISGLFENMIGMVGMVECINNDSSTTLCFDSDSQIDIIVLSTKRIGIAINSNYFIYADKLLITISNSVKKLNFSYEGVSVE